MTATSSRSLARPPLRSSMRTRPRDAPADRRRTRPDLQRSRRGVPRQGAEPRSCSSSYRAAARPAGARAITAGGSGRILRDEYRAGPTIGGVEAGPSFGPTLSVAGSSRTSASSCVPGLRAGDGQHERCVAIARRCVVDRHDHCVGVVFDAVVARLAAIPRPPSTVWQVAKSFGSSQGCVPEACGDVAGEREAVQSRPRSGSSDTPR